MFLNLRWCLCCFHDECSEFLIRFYTSNLHEAPWSDASFNKNVDLHFAVAIKLELWLAPRHHIHDTSQKSSRKVKSEERVAPTGSVSVRFNAPLWSKQMNKLLLFLAAPTLTVLSVAAATVTPLAPFKIHCDGDASKNNSVFITVEEDK